MKERRQSLQAGTAIAVAIGVMNVTTYGYQMLAARLLGPEPYGAFAAVMNVLIVITVIALALQANAARRIAAEPGEVHAVEDAIRRVGRQAALGLAALSFLAAPLVNSVLRLESLPTALLLGLTAVPLTLMGYQAGVLQGERRWQALGLVYVSAGVPRLVVGTGLLLWNPSPFWAVSGVTIGAWAPVLVAALVLRRPRDRSTHEAAVHAARDVWRETLRNSHALLAYFALSNVDVVLARNVMHPQEAGLYAAGLIMTKAVLFLPQFVVVLAFPSMGQAESRRRVLVTSLGAVALIGAVVAAGVSVLSGLAMVFVGGSQYSPVQGSLWIFALLGAVLAMLQLVVYSVLARQANRSVFLVWAALLTVLILGSGKDSFGSLLHVVVLTDLTLLVTLVAISLWRLRAPVAGESSVGSGVPAGAGADGDVEGDAQLRS